MNHCFRISSRWLGVFACVSLLVLASCGGGGGNDGPSGANTPPLVIVPPPGTLSEFAGTPSGGGNLDGVPGRFCGTAGLATDAAGNVYVADTCNNLIRKISSGNVSTVAKEQIGSQYGPEVGSTFYRPKAVAVDSAGTIYFSQNCAIRKISVTGQISTLAGSHSQCTCSDGTGEAARFGYPEAIAADGLGNLYVADHCNTIRKVTSAGVVTTVAGMALSDSYAEGTGADARFSRPEGIAVDVAGNLYVSDSGNLLIRKITPSGLATTLTGIRPNFGYVGSIDGPPGIANFVRPTDMTIDSQGNLLVLDRNIVRKVTPDGVVTTREARYADGTIALLNGEGITVDMNGNVFVAANGAVYKLAPDGIVSIAAGAPSPVSGFADGLGRAAKFNEPGNLAVDAGGNVYVADINNNALRRITPAGNVTTVATNVAANTASNFRSGLHFDLTIDQVGNIVITDAVLHLVRRFMPDGTLVTFAGSQWPDGQMATCGFVCFYNSGASRPMAITGNGLGDFYVVDNSRIRKVGLTGGDSIFTCGGSEFCQASQGLYPQGLVRDSAGNLYNLQRHAVVKISPAGVVAVIAGDALQTGFVDAVGPLARFSFPTHLAIDGHDNIFVADTANNAVRKVTPSGVVTTIAGSPGLRGIKVGALPGSLLNPTGIAVTRDGKTIYVVSYHAVLKIEP
ncbi:MAG: hypothetical protein ABI790_17050 [Betaproteobacteria bacterium]